MYTLREAFEADYPQIVAIINTTAPTPTTVEQYSAMHRRRLPRLPYHLLVAETAGGDLAGFGSCGWDLDQDPGHFYCTVRVAQPHRGKGAGHTLLTALESWARSQGAERLEATLRQEATADLAWAARQGFMEESRVFRSELDLTNWDPALFEPALKPLRESGIRFASLAEVGACEENLRRFHAACQVWERHVPGRGPRTPAYEAWRQVIAEDLGWDPACVLLAIDGDRWVGLTHMEKQKDGSWYTHLTAMDPAYRGRGLGQALKVASVIMARRAGVPSLSTFNHVGNGAMVAINERLGYKPGMYLVQLYKPL